MIMSTIDFVFVSGAFPIILAYAIRVAWRRKQDAGSILTFGWEFVILLRKLALILSAKFTTAYPITGANLQLIILFVSLILQFTYKPYVDHFLNSLDIAFTTLAFGTLLSATQLTFFRDGKTDSGYPIAPSWMISFYWWFNVIALIGGSAVATILCIRKLQHSWEEKERQKELQR